MSGKLGRRFGGIVMTVLLCTSASCASIPPSARAQYRRDQYFSKPQEMSSEIANAMRNGHVVPGMTMEQVWVVVGDPVLKSAFPTASAEVWLYPSVRFHQDHLHGHGATSFRLVFVDGVLRIIDPI
jgi:outer membrane protein assembly factor BamE (lipoprotein component of BamABCDE complex)